MAFNCRVLDLYPNKNVRKAFLHQFDDLCRSSVLGPRRPYGPEALGAKADDQGRGSRAQEGSVRLGSC